MQSPLFELYMTSSAPVSGRVIVDSNNAASSLNLLPKSKPPSRTASKISPTAMNGMSARPASLSVGVFPIIIHQATPSSEKFLSLKSVSGKTAVQFSRRGRKNGKRSSTRSLKVKEVHHVCSIFADLVSS